MQAVEWLSAVLGLAGSLLLASRVRLAGLGFVAYLFSNIGWLVFGCNAGHWGLVWQQAGFTLVSLFGIWTWLIRPHGLRRG